MVYSDDDSEGKLQLCLGLEFSIFGITVKASPSLIINDVTSLTYGGNSAAWLCPHSSQACAVPALSLLTAADTRILVL